jgi:ABC-type dipeptide/oligopeptide/nickel transport system permease subunit
MTDAALGALPVTAADELESPARRALRRLVKRKGAVAGLVVIAVFIVLALFAPWIVPYDPIATSWTAVRKPPSALHWFGTDDLGRDILVRVAYGARVSLGVGVLATLLTVGIGVVLGLIAGFLGGLVDLVLARIVDMVLSVPFLLVAIALVSVVGSSLTITVLVIGFFSWASVARIVRGQVLSIKEREYVEAARSLGAGDLRIMFVDILPNVMAPVIVYTTLLIPVVIVVQATLSFLGLGLPPPTPDWGGMINDSRNYYETSWWYIAFPGAALLITTLAFNLFGDGVRDAFDPRVGRLLRK